MFARHNHIPHLVFCVDNSEALSAVARPTPKPGWALAKRAHDAIWKFVEEDESRTAVLCWIPGHHRILGNERSDKLAKLATALGGASCLPSRSLTHVKRARKAALLERWKIQWASFYPTRSDYFRVHQTPPSLGLHPHFKGLSRRLLALIIQIRLGHCFCGEYSRRHRPDDDISCPCGHTLQTRDHILRDCPLYEDHRHYLLAASATLSVSDLLGTVKGLRAVARFVAVSGAFTIEGDEVDADGPPSRSPTPQPRQGRGRSPIFAAPMWWEATLDAMKVGGVFGVGFDGAQARLEFFARAPKSREAAQPGWEVLLLEQMEAEGKFGAHDPWARRGREAYIAGARARAHS